MSLSNSRHQFLAFEAQGAEDIQYGRKGGVFVTTCVCVSYIFCAVIVAALVGVIVYFITYFKLAQKPANYWDESESFGQTGPPSPNLRLPSEVVPSFYRLKLKTDLDNSVFRGDIHITIRAKKPVNEIILHSKDLNISNNATLTEQIYEKVELLHQKNKRDVSNDTDSTIAENATISSELIYDTTLGLVTENATLASLVETFNTSISDVVTSSETPENIPNGTFETTTETTKVTEKEIPNSISLDTQVTHSSVRNIKIASITKSAGDRLILALASSLKPDVDYTLELSFEGKIVDSLTGFYKSSYTTSDQQTRKLGVTQFEPTSARAAFPCFDEPAFKAQFEISIAHRNNLTALSNMKVSSEEDITDEPGWKWTHFERSIHMSTYLVAYVISDFKSLETTYLSKDNVTKTIRVWTRPELVDKGKYALNITPKLLDYYEDVFGVPYALDKLDLIAIPDFSSGAMENWGLITFRETTLLFDPVDSVPRDKQHVAIDVAHELAHQWFGNLVTMRWWTDLWLNEGFATYIEYVGVDHIEPEWNMFESFSNDKMDLLRSDALKNTSPVSRKVVDASEISQKFDEISYAKGANLIRMLNHTVSEELFHKGLLIYLNDWKFTNAEENDLWAAMSKATKSDANANMGSLSVVDFMNSWTRQAGYPVVNVQRNYETGEVTFEQKLFTSSNSPYKNMLDQLWHIPISYTAMDAPLAEWTAKPKMWLTERTSSSKIDLNDTQALYVNVDAIGYYRVNYDKKNWELLSTALKNGYFKSPITKAQLIDDAFNLAKFSHLNYSQALGLTTCVIRGEESKIVWDLLLNNMAFLKHSIRKTSGYRYLQDYMRILLQKQLERLNFGLEKPKDDNEAFLIENLVMWECEVESPRCLDWARTQFDAWAGQKDINNNSIPNYLRSLVYNMALKHGGRREFDFLWSVFQNSTDPNVKSLIITNLPSTREPSLVTLLLEKSLSEIPNQYAVSVWSVEPSSAGLAQDFLIENFDAVYDKFTKVDEFTFPYVLNGAFGFITTTEELDKLKAFALKHKEKLTPMSQTLHKIVDTATLRINWMKKHAASVQLWLKEYVTKHKANPNTSTTTEPASINTNTTVSEYNTTVSEHNTTEAGITITEVSNVTTTSPEVNSTTI